MSVEDLSRLAREVNDLYAARLGLEPEPLWLLAKLQEELGELTSATLSAKGLGRERGQPRAAYEAAMADEAADLLGFLLAFAAREGIDLDASLRRKWGKYLPAPPPS